MRPTIPSAILALGHARSAARRARDFLEADRLRAQIEAAGYRVVDRGPDFMLAPAHPADVVEADGRVRHGWSGAVPSALDTPPTAAVSVMIVAEGGAAPLRHTLDSLRVHVPAGTQVVIVAPPDLELDAALLAGDLLAPIAGCVPEVVSTAFHLRPAAARNAGGRRAAGAVVVWLQPGVTLSGDALTPLVEALADPGVAVVGAVGLRGTDIRRLEPGPAGDADAIDRTLLAFRREDLATLGPLDEHLHTDDQVDRLWSLILRDGPEAATDAAGSATAEADDDVEADADDDAWTPRRAVALDLPLDATGAVDLAPEPVDPAEAARRRKRDLYRLIDRFTGRPELLRPREPVS